MHGAWLQVTVLAEAEEQCILPQHPLLHRIRQHSATPDIAVDFFTRLFHPEASQRPTAAEALEHPYLKRCARQMHDYLSSSTPPPGMVKPQDSAADLSCIGKAPTEAAKQASLAHSHGTGATALHPCRLRPLHCLTTAAGRRLHVPQGIRLVKRSVGTVLNCLLAPPHPAQTL